MYLDENNNTMPWAMYLPSMPSDTEIKNNIKPICKVMAKYVSGKDAFKCPADPQGEYFRKEGSSYQYNIFLCGIRMDKKELTFTRHGRTRTLPMSEVDVMSDYSGFHGKKLDNDSYSVGAYMYLYADNLIANREREK
jgi:hypothetical protein